MDLRHRSRDGGSRPLVPPLALVLIVGLLAACGGSGGDDARSTTTAPSSTSTSTSSTSASSTSASSTSAPTTTAATRTTTATTTAPDAGTPPPEEPEAPPTPDTAPLVVAPAEGWEVERLVLDPAAGGGWDAVAEVRNGAGEARDGDLVFTVVKGGRTVATLTGSVTGVASGATAEVRLATDDAYEAGPYEVRLEAAFGF